ncbi:hypothetical protein [Alicyclobacillus fastidiosus]|uniref:DUF948 domain-containing protein n=1 Tax=Alicyclobacillus fastidiosus TaxID=392011 RepID=A0ABV5AKD6_9BACL|nr:hypothetical protein [Alicyclobacillus fastidiosus]WEH08462.1 hypothetical protein PYS47_17465 [Alicyclobacillus fastidiosus]
MQSVELQIVQGLLGLLSLAGTAGVAYVVPKVKTFMDARLSSEQATVANSVIDGLGNIAEAVVQEFNQKVVASAKQYGTFTPTLAQSVKQDAIEAVMSQGSGLIALGGEALGDVQKLVSSLIEKAVAENHIPTQQNSAG